MTIAFSPADIFATGDASGATSSTFKSIHKTTPTNAINDPIERSIPPVMITKATPIPIIAKSDVRIRIKLRLFAERNFGSAKAVSRAGVADLEAVDGISAQMARTIYDHFHERG